MCLSSYLRACVLSRASFLSLFIYFLYLNIKTPNRVQKTSLRKETWTSFVIIILLGVLSTVAFLHFSFFCLNMSKLNLPQTRQMCHATIAHDPITRGTEAFCQNVRNISNGGPDHTSAFLIAKYF